MDRDRHVREALTAAIVAMARTVERRDRGQAGHVSRVERLALEIGAALGMDGAQLQGLRLGAVLHDIGKVCLPKEILDASRTLTPAERTLVRAHPEIGYDMLKEIDFPWPVARMVVEHHERLDGSGYPFGLEADAILPESRIIAAADEFDALTSSRGRSTAADAEAALEQMAFQAGRQLDADAVRACAAVLTRDPGLCGGWWPRAA